MSGGALDYAYCKINIIADALEIHTKTPEYAALYQHLLKLSNVLKEVEWVLSGDSDFGKDEKMIVDLLGNQAILDVLKKDLQLKIDQAKDYISKIEKVHNDLAK